MNKVILLGRVTSDIEAKEVRDGLSVANFVLAVASGKDATSFVDVVSFDKQAKLLASSVKKGHRLLVEGELKQEKFETKDGQKRSKIKIILRTFHFVERKEVSSEANIAEDSDF